MRLRVLELRNRYGSRAGGIVLSLSRRYREIRWLTSRGLLDLRRVAALGDHHLAHPEDLLGRPDRAGHVGEHAIVGAPDHQGRLRHQRQERSDRVADRAAQRPQHPFLPFAVLELAAQSLAPARRWRNGRGETPT